MKPRWQKLTAFVISIAAATYAIHVSPPSGSAVVIGGVLPIFITFVTGNVAAKKVEVTK